MESAISVTATQRKDQERTQRTQRSEDAEVAEVRGGGGAVPNNRSLSKRIF